MTKTNEALVLTQAEREQLTGILDQIHEAVYCTMQMLNDYGRKHQWLAGLRSTAATLCLFAGDQPRPEEPRRQSPAADHRAALEGHCAEVSAVARKAKELATRAPA